MAFTYTYTGTEDRIIDIRFKDRTRIVTFQNSGTFEVTYHNERVYRFLKSAHIGDYKSQYQNYQKRENKNYQFR